MLDQMREARSGRYEAQYLSRLKALASTAPPQRSLHIQSPESVLRAMTLKKAPDSRFFQERPDVELFFYEIGEAAAEPSWFRLAKTLDERRIFGRLDPLKNEVQVLESIAMGADVYSLRVRDHDDVNLQYLTEVGQDYGVTALLRCSHEDELARALFVQAETLIGLEDEVAVPGLLDLPIFKDRQVLFCKTNFEILKAHPLKQIFLHLETIEEPYL
jgi:hypothetical protein